MDQKNPTPSSTTSAPPNTTASPASSAAVSQPIEPPPQPQSQQQPQQQTAPPPTSQSLPQQSTPPQPPSSATTTPIATPTPNPSPTPRPSAPVSHTQSQPAASAANSRPHALHRPWQHPHPHSHFPQFSTLPTPSSPSTVPSAPPPSSTSAISGTQPRGGVAIGVPASPAPSSFSPTFGQPFGGLGRGPVSIPDSVTNSSNSQVRQGMQGVQGMGMMGSMASSGAQLRPGGIPAHHQQRPVQSSLRTSSPSPNNQSPASRNFQGHSFIRSPSMGPVSPSPSTSQSMQSPNQPWLSSGSQGKPPLPSPSYRPQVNSPSLQQRPHIPQQQQSLPATSQQLHIPSTQSQQTLPSQQPQEHYGQLPPSRVSQSLAHSQQTAHSQPITYSQQTPHSQQAAHSQQITHSQQTAHSQQITHSQQTAHSQQITHSQQIGQQATHSQQITRVQSSLNQKPSSVPTMQSNSVLPPSQSKAANTVSDESGNRILSKRSIQELVSQIDPSERLDPEVEDILADIADEFIESITTFGCSLAKHRKSDTLEARDILLHLEKNWNMSLPGFGSDEIKTYRKPIVNDIHKERLAAIKKSVVASEMGNAKHSVGQAAGNAKSNMTKAAANAMFSPNSRGS